MKIKMFQILAMAHTFMDANNGGEGGAGGGTPPADAPPAPTPPADVFSGLAPEYVEKLTSSGIKDLSGLAKQFVDLQAHLGTSIRIPSEHASDEDRAKFMEKIQRHAPNLIPRPDKTDAKAMADFYSSIGRPEDPSKYPVEVPEEIKHLMTQDRLAAIQKIAFDNGLSSDQFKAMVDHDIASTKQFVDSNKAAVDADKAKLKQQWGDAYERNTKLVADMAQATGAPEEIVQMARTGDLGADVSNWLYQLSAQISTKEGSSFRDNSGSSTMTPSEAQARIGEIMNNRNHPYWQASHPDHKAAIKTMIELTGYADPTASRDIVDLRASRTS